MKFKTHFDIFSFYDRIKKDNKPVAWCSAFAPAEVLLACGIMPVYPENHAAMLGALSPSRSADLPYSLSAIDRSISEGINFPTLCSYGLSDVGILLGKTNSPINGLPEPSLFYACNSQCAVVERWGDEVQKIYHNRGKEIPHYVWHAPSLSKKEEHTPEELSVFQKELTAHIDDICKRFGTHFDETKFKEIIKESNRANLLWQKCLELSKLIPAPWSNTDAFMAMAPIVIARGLPEATHYYDSLYKELCERVKNKFSFVPNEQVRLIWDAIPIWPRKNWLSQFAAQRGALFVASTYTHSWWFHFDEKKPMESVVKRYAWNTMNRSKEWILNWTLDLVKDYHAQGIVCHWNQSCSIWNSYVKRRLPGYKEAHIPHIVIEADMVDARAFHEKEVSKQLEEFIESLKSSSQKRLHENAMN